MTEWVLGASLLATFLAALPAVIVGDASSVERVLWRLPGTLGIVIPIASFGVGASLGVPRRALVLAALLVYVLLAFVHPTITYIRIASVQSYPLGPLVPTALVELLVLAKSLPPSEYSFAIEAPLARPPNYVAFILNWPVVLAAFTFVNGILGERASALLSPISQRRWILFYGVNSALIFYAAAITGGQLVRRSPYMPGTALAWLPLILPLFALLVAKDRRPEPVFHPYLQVIDD